MTCRLLHLPAGGLHPTSPADTLRRILSIKALETSALHAGRRAHEVGAVVQRPWSAGLDSEDKFIAVGARTALGAALQPDAGHNRHRTIRRQAVLEIRIIC